MLYIIGGISAVVVVLFVYAACFMSGKISDQEERMNKGR